MRNRWISGLVLAVAVSVTTASAQEADPAKVKADPSLRSNQYGVDQRCGVIAQHPGNQGYLNCAPATESRRPYLDPAQAQTIQQQIFQSEPVRSPGVAR